ncbi:hypothetical protein V501_09254 [Pseudogymnoascus sp. VKM F-4519 (FW-2642)]|nr:hypothetical protein V501_09254 [Pseudogymnoascus sp. VKM F-4519 (FW-2642)]
MDPPILNLLPHIHQEHQHLLLRPPKRLHKNPHSHNLHPAQQILHLPRPEDLHPRILRPRINGQFKDLEVYIDETALFEPALPSDRVVDGGAEHAGGGYQVGGELFQSAAGGDGVVVAADEGGYALEFYPAAGFDVAEGVLVLGFIAG